MLIKLLLTACAFGGGTVFYFALSKTRGLPRLFLDAQTDQWAERLAAEARRELGEGRRPK